MKNENKKLTFDNKHLRCFPDYKKFGIEMEKFGLKLKFWVHLIISS